MKKAHSLWGGIALTAVLFAQPASGFEKAQSLLLEDWPELATEYSPGSESHVFAIVGTQTASPEVLYVITWNQNGISQPMGTFRCSKAFEVLSETTNGFYNIRCIDSGPAMGEQAFTLKVGVDGTYQQVR